MASACVNNVGISPEGFLDCPSYAPYGWLGPRISFSRDMADEGQVPAGEKAVKTLPSTRPADKSEVLKIKSGSESPAAGLDLIDFEFRLEDPVAMLPADELFSDGKLVPLQLATARTFVAGVAVGMADLGGPSSSSSSSSSAEVLRSPEAAVAKARRLRETLGADPLVFSPKAPRCSSRWRELLGLKRAQNPKPELQKSASAPPSKSPNPRPLRHFLHRSSKSSSFASDPSLSLPLLRDSDTESVSVSSSRLSLSSSSSSGPDHEDLPRLSLDAEKQPNPQAPPPVSISRNPPRVRVVAKPRAVTGVDNGASAAAAARVGRSPIRRAPDTGSIPARGVSVDSPRMNPSGKIVFQSLERSSSSPSSFNGTSRSTKNRGMERSYSANVRVRPVLNVPVCSLRGSSKSGSVFGFGQLFSQQKKEAPVRAQHRSRTCDRN